MGPSHNPLLGSWKLRSLSRVDAETGRVSNPFGINPVGYLNYSPDGRMMAILLAENRAAPGGPLGHGRPDGFAEPRPDAATEGAHESRRAVG